MPSNNNQLEWKLKITKDEVLTMTFHPWTSQWKDGQQVCLFTTLFAGASALR